MRVLLMLLLVAQLRPVTRSEFHAIVQQTEARMAVARSKRQIQDAYDRSLRAFWDWAPQTEETLALITKGRIAPRQAAPVLFKVKNERLVRITFRDRRERQKMAERMEYLMAKKKTLREIAEKRARAKLERK